MDNNEKFTFSQIKYIICIYRLSQNGYGVKNVELASALGFSKPSIHNMLKSLSRLGVVRHEVFGLAFLTERGRILGERYTYCYSFLESRISEICGIGTVSENAVCALLADMTVEKINELYEKKLSEELGIEGKR